MNWSQALRRERDPLWTREMRERWRRPITPLFLAFSVAALCFLAFSLYTSLVSQGEMQLDSQARGAGQQLFQTLLGAQLIGWIPVSLLLSAPSLAVERERHALADYILAGLSPVQIVRAKFASLGSFALVVALVPLPILALCFPLGGVSPFDFVAGGALEIAVALAGTAMGLAISSVHDRVSGAMTTAFWIAAFLTVLGAPLVIATLAAPPGVWLFVAGMAAALILPLLGLSNDNLLAISRHLEDHERKPTREPFPLRPSAPTSAPRSSTSSSIPPSVPRPVMPFATPTKAPPPIPTTERPHTPFDLWLERVAGWNALTQREVRVQLRVWRSRAVVSPDATFDFGSVRIWGVVVGLGVLALILLPGAIAIWRGILGITVFALATQAAILSSSAFTREREQKMLAQLQLCALSPLEIVAGKIAGTLLLCARPFGAIVVTLCLLGFGAGPLVAFGSALCVVGCAAFAAALGCALSLLCRHTAIASGGALCGVLVAFLLGLIYRVDNTFLNALWFSPVRAVVGFDEPISIVVALFRSGLTALVVAGVLTLSTARRLKGQRTEDAAMRPWERDLSRGWR